MPKFNSLQITLFSISDWTWL